MHPHYKYFTILLWVSNWLQETVFKSSLNHQIGMRIRGSESVYLKLREINSTARTYFKFIIFDVTCKTRIITELSGCYPLTFLVFFDKDGVMVINIAPTVRTDIAHSVWIRDTEGKE